MRRLNPKLAFFDLRNAEEIYLFQTVSISEIIDEIGQPLYFLDLIEWHFLLPSELS